MSIYEWVDKGNLCIYNGLSFRKREILPFVTTETDLEDVVLSEIIWTHLCVGSKKTKLREPKSRMVVVRGWEAGAGWGGKGAVVQKTQTSVTRCLSSEDLIQSAILYKEGRYKWTNKGKASLLVQWQRLHLPIQGIRVWSLAWEESPC